MTIWYKSSNLNIKLALVAVPTHVAAEGFAKPVIDAAALLLLLSLTNIQARSRKCGQRVSYTSLYLRIPPGVHRIKQ